jgi:hypothetical protein
MKKTKKFIDQKVLIYIIGIISGFSMSTNSRFGEFLCRNFAIVAIIVALTGGITLTTFSLIKYTKNKE